jgi:hypothetical protein
MMCGYAHGGNLMMGTTHSPDVVDDGGGHHAGMLQIQLPKMR